VCVRVCGALPPNLGWCTDALIYYDSSRVVIGGIMGMQWGFTVTNATTTVIFLNCNDVTGSRHHR
jgi:hypothetical protein